MSRNELIVKIEALNEWEAMMEEAKTEADAIRNSIKTEMEERGVEELAIPIISFPLFTSFLLSNQKSPFSVFILTRNIK